MKDIRKIKKYALLAAAASALAAPSAMAANSFYAPGDLVLFFQKEGSSNTVYANLGNTAVFRGASAGADAPSQLNFLDLSTTLTSAFGAGWASDPSIYGGLAAVWGTSATNLSLQNGDPNRTLYVSSPRDSVGTTGQASSVGWDLSLAGNTAMTTAASNINAQNNAFENNYDALTTVSLTSVSLIDDQNPFLAPGIQGNAFNTFAGGVQQKGSAVTIGSFGDAGEAEFALDLYRILGRNDVSGQVGGDVRVGSYEGTILVGTNGLVSFVPEPSSFTLIGLGAGALVLRRRRNRA